MDVYFYNQVVVNNTSFPKYTFNKEHKSINYHIFRKAASLGILRVEKEDTANNLDDPLTKLMPYSRNN